MPITSEDFRNTLSQFPAGVTVVTVRAGEEVHGLTATAFASVSADPPLISIFVNQRGRAYPLLQRADAVFAVNFLREGHEEIADRFAFTKEDRFGVGTWTTAQTGAPVLADALAWLDCTVYSRFGAGDHSIYVGEVQATSVARPEEKPLLYWNRGYRNLGLAEEKVTE